MQPCSGGPSNVNPARPARVCQHCAVFDAQATTRLPGFAGSTCTSFQRRVHDVPLIPSKS